MLLRMEKNHLEQIGVVHVVGSVFPALGSKMSGT
jgi:hypothetical protein